MRCNHYGPNFARVIEEGCEMAAAAMAGADSREEPAAVPVGTLLFSPESGRRIVMVGEPRQLMNPAGGPGELIYPVRLENLERLTWWSGTVFVDEITLLTGAELRECGVLPVDAS